ncbi:MAG: L-threonylcarbamoyladenylate synthase [Arenicellales bacterium]
MAQYFEIHPDNPQQRLINQAVEIINRGGVIVYPTDSSYALGCLLGDKQALDRIRVIRRVDARHNFTLVCRDLSELSIYAKVENNVYRLLKHFTPGAYTFILKATGEVPRRLQNPKRKTIGIRVPDNNISLALLEQLDQPLMSSTLILPGEGQPLSDPLDIRDKLGNQVDLIIDGGFCGLEATTVVDMVSGAPEVVRKGKGDPEPFE